MRQIAIKLTLLGGLLLATGIACTDRSASGVSGSTSPATAVPQATAEVIEEALTYTVQSGDFLSEIAAEFDVSLEDLVEVNDIENATLIEVGQVLLIPGHQTVVVADLFALVASAEQWADIFPPQALPPPVEPTPLEELKNRIVALPWPPHDTMIRGGVVAAFALAALVIGLLGTKVENRTRRWATRATPRGARRVFRWWGNVAIQPRHAYLALRRYAIAAWKIAVITARATLRAIKAADQRYRRARTAVIVGWVRTKVHRDRIAEHAKPVLERADDLAGRAVDATIDRGRDLIDNVRDRSPNHGTFNDLGRAGSSFTRGMKNSADRVRRDVFEPAAPTERWRTQIAGELANAFEHHQLEVRYVPVIDLDAHALSAVEAHLFWQHPQRGLMSARDIHTATQKHPELGAALLEFLLEQSCSFVKEKVDRRFPSAQLIVPITLEQIVESEPLAAIDRGLSSANLAIDRLKVSIAEPHALHDSLTATAFIRNLRSMGIGVHLDDFGMATTEDLRQLGVSSVTVDFSAAGASDEARKILSAAVETAQDLRLPVTAHHNRVAAAEKLQVSLGCTFITAHIDEPVVTTDETAAPATKPLLTFAAKRPAPTNGSSPAKATASSNGTAATARAAEAAASNGTSTTNNGKSEDADAPEPSRSAGSL